MTIVIQNILNSYFEFRPLMTPFCHSMFYTWAYVCMILDLILVVIVIPFVEVLFGHIN